MPSEKRLYGWSWHKARTAYLQVNPLCVHCQRRGYVVAANVVDHITPHKGDLDLFWDEANWQALCKPCHDSWKKLQEIGSLDTACDQAGIPIDPRHHWHRGGATKEKNH